MHPIGEAELGENSVVRALQPSTGVRLPLVDLPPELGHGLREIGLRRRLVAGAHGKRGHDEPAVVENADVVAVVVGLRIEALGDQEVQHCRPSRVVPIRIQPVIRIRERAQGETLPLHGEVTSLHDALRTCPHTLGICGITREPPRERQARHVIAIVRRCGEVRVCQADHRLRPCLRRARRRTQVCLFQPSETLPSHPQAWLLRRQRIEVVRCARRGQLRARHHQHRPRNDAERRIARLHPRYRPVIRARVFLVQQFHIIPLPGDQSARCGLLGCVGREITERRGRRRAGDERLVSRSGVRAQIKFHHFIATHRKRVSPRERSPNEPRYPRAKRILPVPRQTLERSQKLTRCRLVRIVRIRGHRAETRSRQSMPDLAHYRAAVRDLGRRIEPECRHHLLRLGSGGPLQLGKGIASGLGVFEADVHPMACLQADLAAQFTRCLIGSPADDKLVIHPEPRTVIRRDGEGVEFRKLRLDLTGPSDGISGGRGDRRARRDGRAKVEIHRGVRARRRERAEGIGVVVFPVRPVPDWAVAIAAESSHWQVMRKRAEERRFMVGFGFRNVGGRCRLKRTNSPPPDCGPEVGKGL